MSEPTKPDPTAASAAPTATGPDATSPDAAAPPTGMLATIRNEISAALGALFDAGKADVADGGVKGGDPAPGRDRSDVTATVKAEIAKLKAAEDKASQDKSMAERIAELEATVKKAAESAPEEFRWITEKMWR
jgi:hypothetical protein